MVAEDGPLLIPKPRSNFLIHPIYPDITLHLMHNGPAGTESLTALFARMKIEGSQMLAAGRFRRGVRPA